MTLLSPTAWLTRFIAALLASVCVLQPAVQAGMSCAAMGWLFPERCCCAKSTVAQVGKPSCCSQAGHTAPESSRDTPEKSFSLGQECSCQLNLPDAPPARTTGHDSRRASSDSARDLGDWLATRSSESARTMCFAWMHFHAGPACAARYRGSQEPGGGLDSREDGVGSCSSRHHLVSDGARRLLLASSVFRL